MFVASDVLMHKHHDVANVTELLQYPEFSAWAILKEALSVVRTGESTFSQTARLAHGYFNMRHDLEIVPQSEGYEEKKVTKWKCVRSLDKQLVCDYCLKLFSMNITVSLQNSTVADQQQPSQPDQSIGSDNSTSSTTTSTSNSTTTPTNTVTNLCPVDVIEDCRLIMCDKCLALGTGKCPQNLMHFCEFQ